jgi:hypothetical protein
MSVSELNFLNRGLSPITLDESSTSCFVLSGSEPNLLNRGLSPITLDESSTSVMRSDGVYVDGSIQGIKVTFTADTGAARTVISSKLFRKIPNSKKPRLSCLDLNQIYQTEDYRQLLWTNHQPLL